MVKCVCISDTHGIHDYFIGRERHKLSIKETGDIFIHAGDFCNTGEYMDVIDFNRWLKEDQIFDKFKHVVIVPGNHDRIFEQDIEFASSFLDERIFVLHDKGIAIDGLYIYGSAWSLPFNNWAFNVPEEFIQKQFSNLKQCDILVTHSPAYGILDNAPNHYNLGSKSLLNVIDNVRPQVHICGHIHHSYGYFEGIDTKHYNVSLVNECYDIVNKPTIIKM